MVTLYGVPKLIAEEGSKICAPAFAPRVCPRVFCLRIPELDFTLIVKVPNAMIKLVFQNIAENELPYVYAGNYTRPDYCEDRRYPKSDVRIGFEVLFWAGKYPQADAEDVEVVDREEEEEEHIGLDIV